MRTLVIGDIHGCSTALQAVVAAAGRYWQANQDATTREGQLAGGAS